MAMDNTSAIPSRIGSRRIDGSRINRKFFYLIIQINLILPTFLSNRFDNLFWLFSANGRRVCSRHGDIGQWFSIHFVQCLLQTYTVSLGCVCILCVAWLIVLRSAGNSIVQFGRWLAFFECGRHIHLHVVEIAFSTWSRKMLSVCE